MKFLEMYEEFEMNRRYQLKKISNNLNTVSRSTDNICNNLSMNEASTDSYKISNRAYIVKHRVENLIQNSIAMFPYCEILGNVHSKCNLDIYPCSSIKVNN